MHYAIDDFLPTLGRTTLALALASLVVAVLLRFSRTTWPTAHRVGWVLALLVGWTFVRWPLAVPWYEAAPAPQLAALAAETFEDRAEPAGDPFALPPLIDDAPRVDAAPVAPRPGAAPTMTAQSDWQFDWRLAVLLAWAAGLVALPALWLVGYWRFVRSLPAAAPIDPRWQHDWRELLVQQGVRRPIPLRITPDLGPMLCRLPRGYELLLPGEVWRELNADQQKAILRHELAHYRRRDVWKSLAARLLALVHWFNPLAWWAVRRFDEAAEWACDLAATTDLATTEYAKALVRMGEVRMVPSVYGSSIHGRTLASRVRRLLSLPSQQDSTMKKSLLLAAALSLVACSLVRIELVARETNAATQPQPEPPPQPEASPQAAAAPLPAPGTPEYGALDAAKGEGPPPAQKMVATAARAFEATLAAFEAETTTLEPVYGWSVRWMNAAEQVAKDRQQRAAAVQEQLDRMRQLQRKIGALYKFGTKGGEAKDMAATNYYVAEAERRLQLAKAPAGTVPALISRAQSPPLESPAPDSDPRPAERLGIRPTPPMLYNGKDLDEWAAILRTELSAERRAEAIRALAAFGAKDDGAVVAKMILETMKDYSIAVLPSRDSNVINNAFAAFRDIVKGDALPAVHKAAVQGTDNQRLFALAVLPMVTAEPKDAVPLLVEALHDRAGNVTQLALAGLAMLAPDTPELEPALRERLHSDNPRVIRLAAQIAGGRHERAGWFPHLSSSSKTMPALAPDLVPLLASNDRGVRADVFTALFQIGEPAEAALQAVKHDGNELVWNRAHTLLKHMDSKNPAIPGDF